MISLLAFFFLSATARAADPLASSLVSSDEVRIRRSPTKIEEFIGHVRYRARSNLMQANWALYDHATQVWSARGALLAEHRFINGDRLQVMGDRASYNMASQRGELLGPRGKPVDLLLTGADGQKDFGSAGRLEWQGRNRISLLDSAHFWGAKIESWADRADLAPAERSIKLTGGRPVLRNFDGAWAGAVKADRITALDGPRRINADGGVRGWIEFKKRKDETGRR